MGFEIWEKISFPEPENLFSSIPKNKLYYCFLITVLKMVVILNTFMVLGKSKKEAKKMAAKAALAPMGIAYED